MRVKLRIPWALKSHPLLWWPQGKEHDLGVYHPWQEVSPTGAALSLGLCRMVNISCATMSRDTKMRRKTISIFPKARVP